MVWTPGTVPDALSRTDTIVALWGVTSGDAAALSGNTGLARAAMQLGRDLGARRVLHCSTAAVYAGGERVWNETDAPTPRGAYGQAKLDMEQAIAECTTPDGPRPCVMRLANVAGADQLFAALDRGGPVTLDRFPNGQGPRRSYVAPRDLMRVFLALDALPPGDLPPILNVTGPAPVAMETLARGAGRQVIWRDAPDTALETMHIDGTRVAELAGPLPDSAGASGLLRDWPNGAAP